MYYYYYYFCCLLFENRAENDISNINCCKSWIVWSTGLNFSLFLNKPLGTLLLQWKIIIQREKRIIKVSLLLWKMPKKHFCITYIFQNIYSKAARKLKPYIWTRYVPNLRLVSQKIAFIKILLGSVPNISTRWNLLSIYFQCGHYFSNVNSTNVNIIKL